MSDCTFYKSNTISAVFVQGSKSIRSKISQNEKSRSTAEIHNLSNPHETNYSSFEVEVNKAFLP